uniref:Uncharacterized mitochondrial protein AtMg00810-like n=1 Tax=Nicotiana tabacum TaxID=4097 RepID=A0A1S3ZK25_TOBAC|nr:PREDICTED: uncharacterized mitochondrial protein AtMg00810-like [Nicotiana tabacum]
MKDLGELKFFLGIEFSRSQEGIVMCQRKYALELVSELGLAGAKPAATPLVFNYKITSIEFDKQISDVRSTVDKELEDKGGYQGLVGRLLYLTMTRPDITFVVQVLISKSLTAYCDSDWGACVESRRSVTCYAVKFGEAMISWK